MVVIWSKNIKEFVWVVVSNKMDKTCVVVVETVKVHPLYNKRYVSKKKYYAHDENNATQIGSKVRIRETSPMSKLKRWAIVEIFQEKN